MLAVLLALAGTLSLAAGQTPTAWPTQFHIAFFNMVLPPQTRHAAPHVRGDATWTDGLMLSDSTIPAARIEHAAGAYECTHFYGTADACTLYFLSSPNQLYAAFANGTCCKDKAIGPSPINWMDNATYSGTDTLAVPKSDEKVLCDRWVKDTHQYWSSAASPSTPVKFAFPNNPQQDMWFDPSSLSLGPMGPGTFVPPASCATAAPCP